MTHPTSDGAEPAYPCDPITNNQTDAARGLSKRELIAAMAMQGLCVDYHSSPNDIDANAILAVRAADALLSELAKARA